MKTSLFDIYTIQREAIRRAADRGVKVVFRKDVTVPTAGSDGTITLPYPKFPMTPEELAAFRHNVIHESLHLTRKESYEEYDKLALPYDHPLHFVVNVLEDEVMEREHSKSYRGDAADISNGVQVAATNTLETVSRKRDELHKADDNQDLLAKLVLGTMLYKVRSRWDKSIAPASSTLEGMMPKSVCDKLDEILNPEFLSTLDRTVTPKDVIELAKDVYKKLFPDKDLDKEIKKAQEESKSKKGKGKSTPDDGKDGEEADGEAIIHWKDLLSHNHEEVRDGKGMPMRIDWTDHTIGRDWRPYPVDKVQIKDVARSPASTRRMSDRYKIGLSDPAIANQIRRALQARQRVYIEPEKREGRIHNPSLYRLAVPMRGDGDWNSRIFKKKKEVEKINTAVTILTDWSGSMSWGNKDEFAVDASAQFVHLFENVMRVPVELLAFTCMSAPVNYIIKDFNDRATPESIASSFASIAPYMAGNADGDSILWAASRLSTRRELRKILIVLSDGSPTEAFTGCAGSGLKIVLEDIRKGGIEVYGIGICDRNVKTFYGKNAEVINDASEINPCLLRTFTNVLIKE